MGGVIGSTTADGRAGLCSHISSVDTYFYVLAFVFTTQMSIVKIDHRPKTLRYFLLCRPARTVLGIRRSARARRYCNITVLGPVLCKCQPDK